MSSGLIIGANGFVGRHLSSLLLERGWAVTAGVHSGSDTIPQGAEIRPLQDIFAPGPYYDTVFLLSAAIPYPGRPVTQEQMTAANVELPKRAAARFAGSRLVYASSVSVYGEQPGTISESTQPSGPNPYGMTKLAGEKAVLRHPNALCLRFSSLYGQGMYPDTFIPRAIRQAVRTGVISLTGDGSRLQDYLAVRDACRYLAAGAGSDYHGVLLGVYGTSFSNSDIAGLIAGGVPGCRISYSGEDTSPSSVYDNRRSVQVMGCAPEIPPAAGIRDLLRSIEGT